MPLYTFLCADCSQNFEELISPNRLGEVTCPKCGSDHVDRQLSLVAGLKSSSSTSSQASCSTGGG